MSILIIQLPARLRLGGQTDPHDAPPPASAEPREYAYVLSSDGSTVGRQGCCSAPMLPRVDTVVAVMAPTDISWHRLTLPRAPAGRLRAALAGMLEEALLTDPEDLHFAVAPMAKAGQPTWVASCDHGWLVSQLMALEKAKVRVERVVPAVWPDEPASAYFHEGREATSGEADSAADVLLTWSSADGVSTWPLAGTLAKALLPAPLPPQTRFFATPAVAAPAERWLGRAVAVQSPSEHLVQAARSLWNMLQFELTPRSKGLHALNDQWRRFLSPQWRPVRVGLMALVAAQILGLNLWAWHQQRDIKNKRAELVQLLKQTHPQVQVVLDAPLQMQRETEALRAQAGQAGDNDLEALMGVVASAWPLDQPSSALSYDGASLTLAPPASWGEGELTAFRNKLAAAGVQVEGGAGRLTVRRAMHS